LKGDYMITKKKWRKLYLKALLREDLPFGLNVKLFVKKMTELFYGILTPGECLEDYKELLEDGLIQIDI